IIRADEPEEGAGSNMSFGFAAQCWVKGVESDKSVGSHIAIARSTQLEITGCYIHHAFTYDGAGTRGYGITLSHHSGECLVQNNILKHLRHALMVKTGANGNVFGYNYSIEPYRSEPIHDFSGDISLHGHYAFSNLFEGNIVQNIIIDHYWGPSGPYNTFFRNRAELYGIIMTTNTILETGRQNFVGNEVTNEQLLYGNYILTGTNHFEFGNNIKGTIIPPGTNDLPDTTYYLDSIPIFWNIIDQLPSLGIPNEIGSGTIPAEERYLSGGILTVCYDSTIYTSFENISNIKNNQIKIMPNPFTHKINLLIPSEINDYCQVNMVNLIGQTVFNKEFRLSKGVNKIVVFPPESIKDGLYIITVKTKNNIYNHKILKQ
ncbi:MAG: T9SS type A sorting domain-containing protein, partial [Bacteroidales bacterium]|nr:T9SS type A sorting domain-containing protein [Bacteroidales bacterium]